MYQWSCNIGVKKQLLLFAPIHSSDDDDRVVNVHGECTHRGFFMLKAAPLSDENSNQLAPCTPQQRILFSVRAGWKLKILDAATKPIHSPLRA